VRGDLNQTRLDVVNRAFSKLDKDGNGYVEYEDIKDTYSADRHPDVIQGKRTKQQVLVEFLETFETQLDIMQGRARDGRVTLEEFTEYYRSISSSIDDDDYFVVVLNNSWNINGNADPYKKFERGWIADDA
jgi:Ca2+-binding EF-hand superfamily protein